MSAASHGHMSAKQSKTRSFVPDPGLVSDVSQVPSVYPALESGIVGLGDGTTDLGCITHLMSVCGFHCRCYFDLRNPAGQWYLKLVSVLHTSYILLLSISYLAIWMKIKRTAKPVNTDRRYRGSSRTMSFLVVIYVIQYSPSVLLSVWSWFGPPHILVYFLSVVFVNSGGVLNCFAYMYITRDRRRRNNVGLENR